MVTTINGKKYTVEHVFNMVGNWHFVDRKGNAYLVDGEDVSGWAEENNRKWEGVQTAIAYAKELAVKNGGVFWWKVLENNQ